MWHAGSVGGTERRGILALRPAVLPGTELHPHTQMERTVQPLISLALITNYLMHQSIQIIDYIYYCASLNEVRMAGNWILEVNKQFTPK